MKSMKTILLVTCIVLPAISPAAPVDVDALRAELRAANAANDGTRVSAAAAELRREFTGHPAYLYYAARGAALSGDHEKALRFLANVTARGVDMLAPVANDAAFEPVRALSGYSALLQQRDLLHAPAGQAAVAWSFGEPDTQPEAVALDSKGCVYIGSVQHGDIMVRDTNGDIRHWPAPGRWSVQGLHFSPDGKQLWAASSAMNVSRNADSADHGRSALIAFDPGTGKVIAQHQLPESGEHVLGDFLFLDADTVLATDSIGGGVYALDMRSGEFVQRVKPGTLRSPQGLALLGGFVIIADYSNGLYRFDPVGETLLRIEDGPAAPYGIDGLYVHENAIIAIHNGVQPYQVNRYALSSDAARIVSRETLLANHPAFGEPTLGTVAGETLYLVANSLWNHVTAEGTLPAAHLSVPVILSLDLSHTAVSSEQAEVGASAGRE